MWPCSFRSDPDRWARYFRVQRMIAQLDRVEREAAEKRRVETEIADESQPPPPPARLHAARKSSRRPSSALKVLVFGSGSGSVPAVGVDPAPLLPSACGSGGGGGGGRGSDLKWSRSADARLNACGGVGGVGGGGSQQLLMAVGAAPYLTAAPVSRTHSCDESAAAAARVDELREMTKRSSPRPSTTLQVHRV